jgi:CheY-like chemotaxis protein
MANQYDWTGKRIIIADDDLINFELLNLILRFTKAELIHINNGQLVLDYINSGKTTDLILMDIQMPVLDGIKATEILRANGYKGCIFALTALNTSINIKKYNDAGFNEIIEKPVRRDSFLKLIDNYFSKK